jgi:hypothetical protein
MKKLILLIALILSLTGYSQAEFENIKITENVTENTATKVVVQSANNVLNTISKSDLVNVEAYASAVNLPVTGIAGKIYITNDDNRLYRWNGTIYVELADANNVKLTGNQTIAGNKTFSERLVTLAGSTFGNALSVTDANLILSSSDGSTNPALVIQTVGNDAIRSSGTIKILDESNQQMFSANNLGIVTALSSITGGSFIKSGATSTNLLLAGGTDITQDSLPISTATQTALNGKLNLTGGTLTDALNGTSANFSTSVTAVGLLQSQNRLLLTGVNPLSSWISSAITSGYDANTSEGYFNADGTLLLATNGVSRLTLNSGVATFSSTVTAANGTALNHLITKAQTLYTNQTITANKTVTIAEFTNNNHLVLRVDTTSGNVTITLPTFTALQGYKVTVKKSDSSANSVNITGVSGVNIDGASTLVISGQYSKTTIGADLVQYIIL